MNKYLKALLLLLASAHLLIAAYITINHLSSDVMLNSAEGNHAQFIYQAGEGMPLYGDYDYNYTPNHYTPLTFQLCGFVSKIWDYDIRAMRAVIALFAALSFFVLWKIVFHLTQSKFFSWIAIGLFAGIDVQTYWYVYLDTNVIHTFFALLAVLLLLRDSELKWKTTVLVSVCLYLSFWSKQTAVGYIAAGLFYFFIKNVRQGFLGLGVLGLLLGGTFVYFASQPDSMFVSKLFSHGTDPINWEWLLSPTLYPEYLGRFGVAFAVVVAGLFYHLGCKWREWLKPFYIFLGAALVVGTVTRLKYGSGPTQAIFFYGMLIAAFVSFLKRFWDEKQIGHALVAGLIGIQACALFHEYQHFIITDKDKGRHEYILKLLETPGKTVLYHNHGFMNVWAGKPMVSNAGWGNYSSKVRDYYQSDPFDLIILSLPLEATGRILYDRLDANYVPTAELPAEQTGSIAQTLRSRMIVFQRKDQVPAR